MQNRCGTNLSSFLPISRNKITKVSYHRFCFPPLIRQGFALPPSPKGKAFHTSKKLFMVDITPFSTLASMRNSPFFP